MRSTTRLLGLAAASALAIGACAAPGPDSSEDERASTANLSSTSGACSMSRAAILGSVSDARRQVITRGFAWLDAHVPYSQSATHEGYRTDCSGFVSMCWETAKPGETTSSFAASSKYQKLGSYNDLVPGDALDSGGHHVVMFLGWNDAAKTGICVLEQASTASDMQFRVRSTASLKSEYKPMRAPSLVNDTALADGTQAGGNTDDKSDSTSKAPPPSDDKGTAPPPPPPPPPQCVPKTCDDAFDATGVECGMIADGCGGTANCDTAPGFGCLTSETCVQNVCITNGTDAGAAPPPPPPPPPKSSAPAPSEPSSDVPEADPQSAAEGEPGDIPSPTTNGKSSSSSSSGSEKSGLPQGPGQASSGCSAVPSQKSGGESSFLALGVVIAASLIRRRRRSSRIG